jgi:hypothetical protein
MQHHVEHGEYVETPKINFITVTTLITLAFMPALFIFSTATQENVQYIMPNPAASRLVVRELNLTLEFFIVTTSLPRVKSAWIMFGVFVLVGLLAVSCGYYVYDQMHGRGRIRAHAGAYMSGKDRILLLEEELAKLKEKKAKASDEDEDSDVEP